MIRSELRQAGNSLPSPDEVDDPTIAKAITHVRRMMTVETEAQAAESAARGAASAATTLDREAFAKAIAVDKPDPGTVHAEKAGVELDAARRRREAAELAVEEAFTALAEAVEKRREGWADKLVAREDVQRAQMAELARELDEAGRALARTRGLARWVEAFPSGKIGGATLRLVGLVNRGGEDYSLAQALAAIRGALEEPPPAL